MTTRDDVHLLGTKPVHIALPAILAMLGSFLGYTEFAAMGIGMLLVLLFGNMRAQAEHYRWTVENEDTPTRE